ncbi:ribose transport system permease protein [Microbacterium sp. W4I4]|uniref:ABC transporter permease n=1 Tax=Microbacterium sp. W4I4 TaxID=3042295 RepID=UPI00277FCE34|nr:ABC transporter permease [Microbacterium sp. W4I4]MDQ0615052.1 ribose transport system permease protein [Microbacterium sp. W4I4]
MSGSTTTVVQTAVNEDTQKGRLGAALRNSVQQSLALGTLVVLFVFFAIFGSNFTSASNIENILMSTVLVGVLALGTTFVIVTGGIDLSLGFGMTLCSVMMGTAVTGWGLPVWAGVLAALATGALIGLINGLNITFLRLPPFIATLAMMMIAQGLALVISQVKPITFAPDVRKQVTGIVQFDPVVAASDGYFASLPAGVLIFIVLAVVTYLVLNKTILGRYTFAIGSNEEATRLSGVNTRRWTIWVYVFAGVFIGIAGVLLTARLGSAQPTAGAGYELQAIAAVIIGGTSLLGGRGSIVGTVIGAFIMSVLINGLRSMSIQTEWQYILTGVVILIAVFFDALRNRGKS